MNSSFSKKLLENYQNGDSRAAFEIYSRYANRLFRLARSRIGAKLATKIDPDDVLQSAFQAFFAKADRDEVFCDGKGDLWRLLAAICINHVKREAEHYAAAKRDLTIEAPLLEYDHQLENASHRLDEWIESILLNESPLTGKVVQGRLAGFSLKEIAKHTNRSERTIRRILHMLKAKLALQSGLNLEPHLARAGAQPPTNGDRQFNASYENYDLLKMLGAGAFGKVYLARDRRSDSMFAVKALRRDWIGDASAEVLFLNEAKILSAIKHPNVVQFFDAGPLPNGSWFLVLEYLDGLQLGDHLKRFDVGVPKLLSWLSQICAGLFEIHKQGLVHGDLKPSNIIICGDCVRVIDFGFSKRFDENERRLVGGTTGYMAPERTSSTAADVFSLGRIIGWGAGTVRPQQAMPQLGQMERLAAEACHRLPERRPTVDEIHSRLNTIQESVNH